MSMLAMILWCDEVSRDRLECEMVGVRKCMKQVVGFERWRKEDCSSCSFLQNGRKQTDSRQLATNSPIQGSEALKLSKRGDFWSTKVTCARHTPRYVSVGVI